MIKRYLTGLILLLAGFPAVAHVISPEQARLAGTRFFYERINQYRNVDLPSIGISGMTSHVVQGEPVYYILNLTPSGYVIVSAESTVPPVLAYAFDGQCTVTGAPEQFTAWVKQYEKQILYARGQKAMAPPAVTDAWDHLLGDDPATLRIASSRSVEPLITSNWDQGNYYNGHCPADAAGPGGHTYAGCVPTCMGQVMYYFRWPQTGTGSYTYDDPPYGTLSADFGATTYEWEKMPNSINNQNDAIAELLFHLGVSCDLQYGPGGSGMYNHKAAYSLRTFFKYSPQTRYLYRDSTTLDWDSVLIAHLDRKMPMYYAGWDVPNISGHAFVCDGYQDSLFFHFNFGWSGSNNGYFYTSDLTPGGYNFNLAQEVIINCYPDTLSYIYPQYCAGATTLTYKTGSIDDGSGPMHPYQHGADCSWLIDPQTDVDSITSITLTFDRFDTNPEDFVRIYDGGNAQAPLLAAFSGANTPGSVTSTGNKMFITFAATGAVPGNGWFATYKTTSPVWCTGNTTITADTAVVTNGSFTFNYSNNTNCRWKLQPANGLPITIYFRRFDTEPGKDILRIYDLETQDTLAELSGHYEADALPDSVTAPSGKMFLNFTSNSSVTGKGWEIYYPASHVGLGEEGMIRTLEVYPNPASNEVTIRFTPGKAMKVSYSVSDIRGRSILSGSFEARQGENVQQIGTSMLQPGVYLLRLVGTGSVVTQKIVIQ
jgi:hypothetical protein